MWVATVLSAMGALAGLVVGSRTLFVPWRLRHHGVPVDATVLGAGPRGFGLVLEYRVPDGPLLRGLMSIPGVNPWDTGHVHVILCVPGNPRRIGLPEARVNWRDLLLGVTAFVVFGGCFAASLFGNLRRF